MLKSFYNFYRTVFARLFDARNKADTCKLLFVAILEGDTYMFVAIWLGIGCKIRIEIST